eukprot:14581379-Alexandrium_andersonii.AAC.1
MSSFPLPTSRRQRRTCQRSSAKRRMLTTGPSRSPHTRSANSSSAFVGFRNALCKGVVASPISR